MEMLQDFARGIIDDTKAMTTIADVINGKDDIEAALCQELGDRVFAQLEKMPAWSVSQIKYPEGQAINIDCGSDRWDYAVWAEGKELSHGFMEKGKPFTKQEKAALTEKLPGDPQEFEGNYFCVAFTVDLSDRKLAERFTDSAIRRFVNEVKAIIG